jgi:hypothetical protein
MAKVTSAAFDAINRVSNKNPVVVLEIEGLPFVIGSNQIFESINYDDPNTFYDDPLLTYDGLRPINPDKQKSLIDRAKSFATISQKLEQWDGKASVETFNIRLVDENGIMTRVCTPGYYIEDIMNRKVTIRYGFQEIAYPEDYMVLFRGYVNNVRLGPGWIDFIFTDPSAKRKQVLFNASTVTLSSAITDSDTTLTISSTQNLYQTILNAKGVNDSSVTIGLVLDGKEIVTYENADILSSTQVVVNRAQLGSLPSAHDAGIEIKMFIRFDDNPVNIALKSMLSGFNGSWLQDVSLRSINNDDAGNIISDTITFGPKVNLSQDYGLVIGDFITLSGSSIPANNATFTIAEFVNDRTVKVVETGILNTEPPPISGYLTTVSAFRSKYDVYPTTAGLSLTPQDVFVSAHEDLRDTYIQFNYDMRIVGSEDSGKTWIETHLFKPIGGYSLTQGSMISMGLSKPPLTNDLSKVLDPTNVVKASECVVERGINTRFFYNEVLFQYAWNPLTEKYGRSLRIIDADAQKRMRQVSVLKIEARGFPDTVQSQTLLKARANRVLQRHRFATETVDLVTNFGTGNLVDAGDVMVLSDSEVPVLQISNTEQASRGIGARIMEVQERTINLSQGNSKMRLLSNNGFSLTDRYGVISPSSKVTLDAANSNALFKIKDSFGSKYPGAEYKKWQNYAGSRIIIHDNNWTRSSISTFSVDPVDPYFIHLDTALSFVPQEDDVMELAPYDDSSSSIDAAVKAEFCWLDSTATIFSGSSSNVFVLDSGFSSRYQAGMICYVQSPDGSRYSPDLKILSVVGDIVTVGPIISGGSVADLGFVPQNGDMLQLASFKDGGAGYRFI